MGGGVKWQAADGGHERLLVGAGGKWWAMDVNGGHQR